MAALHPNRGESISGATESGGVKTVRALFALASFLVPSIIPEPADFFLLLPAEPALKTAWNPCRRMERRAWVILGGMAALWQAVRRICTRAAPSRLRSKPKYCCVILEGSGERAGRILLESRGRDARIAAGRLTCFGGKVPVADRS